MCIFHYNNVCVVFLSRSKHTPRAQQSDPHDLLSDQDLGAVPHIYLQTHPSFILGLALSVTVVVGAWGMNNVQSFRMIVENVTAEHYHCAHVLIP